ncbi:class I adenylate-forming enzyme family protein [Castellaniella sp. MT123]|uniref:class I adenylate-forming enzyme family protein n=1 Tax=Castellaniella sp. MT123 TaxID=3140381 RepID=UPI0031F3F1FF
MNQSERIHHLLRRQALDRPGAILLHLEEGGTVTYADMWQRAQLASDWLAAQGARLGDRVMIVGENCPEMVQVLFACSVLGAWAVGLNARLSHREIEAVRAHAQPVLTLYFSRTSATAAEHAAQYAARPADASVWGAGNLWSSASDEPEAETGPLAGAVATLIYTSGTTGAPKAVMVPHQGLAHFARMSSASRGLTAADVSYAALPLSHIFGIATVLMATVQAGASLVVRRRFDPADLLKSLQSPGLSILQGVPTMYSRLLAAFPAPVKAPRLRYVYAGGSALDPTLKQQVEHYFDLPMHHGYGITEYAGSLYVTPMDRPRSDCSAGYPLEGVELRLGVPGTPAVPVGESGAIYVRGPGVMLGYYKDPERTREALLPGGWLCTGDLGRLSADGALFITGRTKDMIIRSGFNVYPLEVEAVINTFPGIKLSAVVGRDTADGNEEVIAFFEPLQAGTVDLDALRAHVRTQLAPYKVPARLVPIDVIPTTVSGKIKKQPLRELAAAGAGND